MNDRRSGDDDQKLHYRQPFTPVPTTCKPHPKNPTIVTQPQHKSQIKSVLTGLSNKPCWEYRYSCNWCKNWKDGRLYNSAWTSTTVDKTDGWTGSGNTNSLSADSGSEGLLLDVEEEVDGVACADPDDLTLPLLPDFAFFFGTSNSAEIGSQYKAFSFRTDNLSKTCWWEYKISGRGPGSDGARYQCDYSERPNDTLPTTLLRCEQPFTPVSATDTSHPNNYNATS